MAALYFNRGWLHNRLRINPPFSTANKICTALQITREH
jgi:hypothetical protein